MSIGRLAPAVAFRRLLRGRIEWDRVESALRAVAERHDAHGRVEFLEADNWLSVPCVVDDQYFVKLVSRQHALLHALLTTGRNLGAFSRGEPGFFEHVRSPAEMVEREFEAATLLRDRGVNVPEPVDAFEHDGLGVLVVEYLPEFRTLDDLDPEAARRLAPDLFAMLRRAHDAGVAHGDLRAENVLVAGGEWYFIDATSVRDEEGDAERARAYDLACAMAALAPLAGAGETVEAALSAYATAEVLAAREFLDFVRVRPDHDFDAAALKGEIEREAA
jgi:tRNA A-37 threonylcarbamoyl transferase component Bud32